MERKKILLIEDEVKLARFVELELKYEGYDVTTCHDGRVGMEMITNQEFDMILLDLMLPEEDGISILKKLRQAPETAKLPILLLTAKSSEYDKVLGLDSGADDYVAKPFGMMELVARAKALLRRTAKRSAGEEFRLGMLYVSLSKHLVMVEGEEVTLTNKEFSLLTCLLQNQGRVLTRDQLLNDIWGYSFDGENRTVDVHIRTLRHKLGDAGQLIKTVRGVGYKIGGEPSERETL